MVDVFYFEQWKWWLHGRFKRSSFDMKSNGAFTSAGDGGFMHVTQQSYRMASSSNCSSWTMVAIFQIVSFIAGFCVCFSLVSSSLHLNSLAHNFVSSEMQKDMRFRNTETASTSPLYKREVGISLQSSARGMLEKEIGNIHSERLQSDVSKAEALKKKEQQEMQILNEENISRSRPIQIGKNEHPDSKDGENQCRATEGLELWGDAVKWGTTNKKNSWKECCEDCVNFASGETKCNIWVYCYDKEKCGDMYKDCWLKYEAPKDTGPTIRDEGPHVMWASGSFFTRKTFDSYTPTGKKYHILITTSKSIYQQWQARIMFYWYKRVKEMYPNSDIGGFTRILHSFSDDHLSQEMPTIRVDPLKDDGGYVVLSRPFAFNNFIQDGHLDAIEEDYIMMSEPDHVFVRPVANFIENENQGICFPFFYIEPKLKKNKPLISEILNRTMSDDDLGNIDGTGNSPVIISKKAFKKIAPRWHDYTIAINENPETKKAWGWVLEMWAYTLAAYAEGVKHILFPEFMCQPPWDTQLKNFSMIHYTYGMDTDLEGKRILNGTFGQWRFDKRSYYHTGPKRDLEDPPPKAPEVIKTLISMINEATSNIPTWNQY